MESKGGVRASNKRQLQRDKDKALRAEAQQKERRVGEIEVDELPDELKCTYRYQEFGVRCEERATESCHLCSSMLCVAHVRSRVTTQVAKPVVRKGAKEPEIECESCYCVDCATGPDGSTLGVLNTSFNQPGDYV